MSRSGGGRQRRRHLDVPLHPQLCRGNKNCCCWNLILLLKTDEISYKMETLQFYPLYRTEIKFYFIISIILNLWTIPSHPFPKFNLTICLSFSPLKHVPVFQAPAQTSTHSGWQTLGLKTKHTDDKEPRRFISFIIIYASRLFRWSPGSLFSLLNSLNI